jgi:hypothetical protein
MLLNQHNSCTIDLLQASRHGQPNGTCSNDGMREVGMARRRSRETSILRMQPGPTTTSQQHSHDTFNCVGTLNDSVVPD